MCRVLAGAAECVLCVFVFVFVFMCVCARARVCTVQAGYLQAARQLQLWADLEVNKP